VRVAEHTLAAQGLDQLGSKGRSGEVDHFYRQLSLD
jgi:hypothetical protein